MKLWTNKEVEILHENYSWNPRIDELLPDRPRRQIVSKANREGLKVMGRGRAWGLKVDFFDHWSEEMAYVYGLIVADGCIMKRKDSGIMVIDITLNDEDHIRRLANLLGVPERVYSNSDGTYHLRFVSNYIAKRLMKLKVPFRKSLVLGKLPVPKKFFSHFLRGYFDGDGSFSINAKGRAPMLSFTSGSYNFLRWIQAKLKRYYGFPMGRLRNKKGTNTWNVWYRKSASIFLMAIMYRDKGDLFLRRKYNRYISYLSDQGHTIREKEFISLLNARLPQKEVEEIVHSLEQEKQLVTWWKPVESDADKLDIDDISGTIVGLQ